MKKLTIERMVTLPQETQERIKETLKAYDEIFVSYENGNYCFGTCIKKDYAQDHEVLGTIYASDIYNEVERMENYINTFCDYPIEYKEKRDYKMIKKMEASKKYNEDYTVCTMLQCKLVNGKLEIVNFIDDVEKMVDFELLGKDDFLQSYSYLSELEYDNTLILKTL